MGEWQVIVVLVVARGEMTVLSARHVILSLRVVGGAMGVCTYESGCSGPGGGTILEILHTVAGNM